MAQQAFPILTVDELLRDAAELTCPLNRDDLTHPSPARVQAIYEWFMWRLLGLNSEAIKNAVDEQLAVMEHPDMYIEALKFGVFQLTFNQLLLPAGIYDFSFKDLAAPTAQRFSVVLSALINFALFELEHEQRIMEELDKGIQDLEEQEQTLVQKSEQLRKTIEADRETRAENKSKMEAQREKAEREFMHMQKVYGEAKKLHDEAKARKEDIARTGGRMRELNHELDKLKLVVSELQTQIVSSPDKLQGRIQDLHDQLRRHTEMFKETEIKERQTTSKINALNQYTHELASCVRLLEDWQNDVDRLREMESKLQQHQDDLQQLEAEQSDLRENIRVGERRIGMAQAELLRAKDRMDRKKAEHVARKQALEDQHAECVQKKREYDDQAAKKNAEAQQVEQQIRDMHAALQLELDKGEKAFKRIKQQITKYSIRLNQALDSINELNAIEPDF